MRFLRALQLPVIGRVRPFLLSDQGVSYQGIKYLRLAQGSMAFISKATSTSLMYLCHPESGTGLSVTELIPCLWCSACSNAACPPLQTRTFGNELHDPVLLPGRIKQLDVRLHGSNMIVCELHHFWLSQPSMGINHSKRSYAFRRPLPHRPPHVKSPCP